MIRRFHKPRLNDITQQLELRYASTLTARPRRGFQTSSTDVRRLYAGRISSQGPLSTLSTSQKSLLSTSATVRAWSVGSVSKYIKQGSSKLMNALPIEKIPEKSTSLPRTSPGNPPSSPKKSLAQRQAGRKHTAAKLGSSKPQLSRAKRIRVPSKAPKGTFKLPKLPKPPIRVSRHRAALSPVQKPRVKTAPFSMVPKVETKAASVSLSMGAGVWTPQSRRTGLIAIKKGMSTVWDEFGIRVPVTVLQVQSNQVITNVFTPRGPHKAPYRAVQVGRWFLVLFFV